MYFIFKKEVKALSIIDLRLKLPTILMCIKKLLHSDHITRNVMHWCMSHVLSLKGN